MDNPAEIVNIIIAVASLIFVGGGALATSIVFIIRYIESAKTDLTNKSDNESKSLREKIDDIASGLEKDIETARQSLSREVATLRDTHQARTQKLEDDLRSAIEHNKSINSKAHKSFTKQLTSQRKELSKDIYNLDREMERKFRDVFKELNKTKVKVYGKPKKS